MLGGRVANSLLLHVLQGIFWVRKASFQRYGDFCLCKERAN